MRKLVCDRCKNETTDIGSYRTLQLTIKGTGQWDQAKQCHEVDWCGECIKKLIGKVPATYSSPPSNCEKLFEAIVEDVLERVRDDS